MTANAKPILAEIFARLKAGKRTPLTSVLRPSTEEPERERGPSAPVLNRGVE